MENLNRELVRAFSAMAALGFSSVSISARAADNPIVATDKGNVQGFVSDGAEAFLGIPYAAPPVGSLRWAPPKPAAQWNGVRQATSYRSYCPQAKGIDDPPGSVDEDCLYLNVQRPIGTTASQKLPVFVWVHGGGDVTGSGDKENMAPLVSRTPIVAVTLNYRLGVLGFLALPSLAEDNGLEDGNYGFEDQQAVLRWVRRNIANFGGDPSRVTLGGESSGAIDVCSHLSAPRSKGLFSQAIISSGQCLTQTLQSAESQATAIASSAGCIDASTTASCMRSKSVSELLTIQNGGYFQPISGTLTLPVSSASRVSSGTFNHVPLLVGTQRDEGRSFTQPLIGIDADEYTALVASAFGAYADRVLRHYPFPVNAGSSSDVAYQYAATLTDSGAFVGSAVENGIGGCATSLLVDEFAKYVPVYSYEFANRNGPGWYPVSGYEWGAGHGTSNYYLYGQTFNNVIPEFTAEDTKLQEQMYRYWGAFIANGNPAVAGQADWPVYNQTSVLLRLKAGDASGPFSMADFRKQHNCDFWDKLRGANVESFVSVPDNERGG